jgi:succinate-semialdehyde dehydrogenase/glutarate-semialdehyde dehydrogenase
MTSTASSDYIARARALETLAARIEEEADLIVATLVRELETTVRSARTRELDLPVKFLRDYGPNKLEPLFDAPLDLLHRRPYQKVAIMLPYNAIGIASTGTIAPAYLAGNQVLLRLPSRVPDLSSIYQRLIESTLPGVTVVAEPGPSFLERCFVDPEIELVYVFGDDRWFSPPGAKTPARDKNGRPSPNFRELARRTRTKVIFDGPGKDPFVVFSDANIEKAAEGAIRSAYINAGQSCSSPERFYVHESVADAFIEAVVRRTSQLRIGPPGDEATDIGPIGSAPVLARIQAQFDDARARGARFLAGGEIVTVEGCRSRTCLPTVVDRGSHEMLLFREETFGPVIPIMTFTTEAEVDALVNDSDYGLTATVYGGSDAFHAGLVATHGSVFRDSCIVDPEHALCRLNWGGFRNSGWIWEWQGPNFVRREGPRRLLAEFSQLSQASHP